MHTEQATIAQERPDLHVSPIETAASASNASPSSEEQAQFAAIAEQVFSEDGHPEDVQNLNSLSQRLLREFSDTEKARHPTEQRWLKDLRQYRGQYEPEIEAELGDHSKAFVRKTRVKVKTLNSRVADLLFPAGTEKNWSMDTTPKPEVDDELKANVNQQLQQANGGQQPTPDQIDERVLELARESAKRMEKVIEDQLAECRYKEACLKAIHSGNLYGTGILKGPLVERKIRTKFVREGGKWKPTSQEYAAPFVDHVPLWNFFPDMSSTELQGLQFAYERHLMTAGKLLELAGRRSFSGKRQVIIDYVKSHPRGQTTPKDYDTELRQLGDRYAVNIAESGQFEVLERWGWLAGDDLKEAGYPVPEERMVERFFCNAWLLPNGEVIKCSVQPINGNTWPYHIYYFDKDETSFFGEGVATIMRDDQEMLNAAVRMMLDNGALTSGPVLEIFVDLLTNSDDTEVGPWKKFFRNSSNNPQVEAVRAIEIPNHIEWLSKMAERFDVQADETTAIPRYMTGENASEGAAGTASGMSMLMGAANIVLKDLITSWDEGITRTFLEGMYHWNMQFHPDNSIKGDFDVKARGTASLVAKEVRAQRLNEFAESCNNPADAPFIKRLELLRERAAALEMSDIIKSQEEVEAEQNSEQAKKLADLQQRLAEANVALAEGQAQKVLAEAMATKKKVDEMLANIELTLAKAVDVRVQSAFAALQAGGTATANPLIAPAADEILRSAGWVDATPSPSIAQLDGPPVQQQANDQALLGKGQSFVADPRVQHEQSVAGQPLEGDPVPPSTNGDMQPEPAHGQPTGGAASSMPGVATGHVGERAGIETARVPG